MAVLPSSTKRASMYTCFGLRSMRSTIFAQVSSISSGAVTMTEFASTNGTAISPTTQLSFVSAAPPRHVRLKFAATSVASAYLSSNMRDSTPPPANADAASATAKSDAAAARRVPIVFIPSPPL